MPGGKQNCMAGRLGLVRQQMEAGYIQIYNQGTTQGLPFDLVAFLIFKVKFTLERGIRSKQKCELGKTSRTAGTPFLQQPENTGRSREALPPSKHLHTHTQSGFSFTFL